LAVGLPKSVCSSLSESSALEPVGQLIQQETKQVKIIPYP